MTFNPTEEQRAVIEANPDGAFVVSGVPGCGKTATIVWNYEYWVNELGIAPSSILAISLTKDASVELADRIKRMVPNAYEPHISTIHAFHYRTLKEEGLLDHPSGALRSPPDSSPQGKRKKREHWRVKDHINTALELVGLGEVGYKDAQQMFDNAKAHAVRTNVPGALEEFYRELIDRNGGCEVSYLAAEVHNMLADAHRLYDEAMLASGIMNFSDMICEVRWLFEDRPAILKKYQERIHHVIVDEAQDTPWWAMETIYAIAAPQNNVRFFGDEDQWILGFTGADVNDNMREGFQRRFENAEHLRLTKNFRSTETIVNVSQSAIDPNYHDGNAEYRKEVVARDDAGVGPPVTYETFETVYEEAKAIADYIRQVVDEGKYEYGEIFIGTRTRKYLGFLEGKLVEQRIPFVNEKGGTFFDSRHVRQLVHYMRLSVDKTDDEAFETVYNIGSRWNEQQWPLRKDGRVVRQKGDYCNHRYLGKDGYLPACGATDRWEGRWNWAETSGKKYVRAVTQDFEDFMGHLDEIELPGDKAAYIVDNCLRQYWVMEEGSDSTDDTEITRLADLFMVVDMAKRFDSCDEFFAYIQQMIDAAEEAKRGDSNKLVVITTMHGLKGRERPLVIGGGVMDGILPHAFSIGGGAPRFDDRPRVLPSLRLGGNSVESERCLWYVLISRAQNEFRAYGAHFVDTEREHEPSRFAFEVGLLDAPLIDEAEELIELAFGETDEEQS